MHRPGPLLQPGRFVPAVVWATVCLSFDAAAGHVDVRPAQVGLSPAVPRQQLVVSVTGPDDSARDLTSEARYSVEPAGLAKVSNEGVVTPLSDGEGVVRVEAGGASCAVPLRVVVAGRPTPVSYRRDVVALLSKAGCNMGACHGNLNGKGGFRLSLRGDDPAFDLAALTRDAFARRLNTTKPAASLAYLKPTGQVPHEGGLRFAPGSQEAATLLSWIEAGATDDVKAAPTVTSLEVFPEHRYCPSPALSQQLLVTATFSDGSRRDVTRQASYDVNDPTKVTVTADGKVQVARPTEAVVAVRYLTGRAVSRLAFLADRPGFTWSGPEPSNIVDRHVFAKLRALKVNPSEPSTDAVFLRRASLDATGRLPTPKEVRAFLNDEDPDKRSKLVDRLLARPEFADVWALRWADLLRNEEMTMGAKGVWVFQRWLRDRFAADAPLDEFARSLVTSSGSTWVNPPASFYRTNRDPETAAETVAQVFLGVRLQCARCHNHPFDVWTQDDYYGLAACFANVRHKELSNVRKDALDKHEINGDEFIYLDGAPETVQPRSGAMMAPKAPRGPKAEPRGDQDARRSLADWLTRDNRQFARNLANRVWFHLMGRGVVDPVDDFRDSNPPSNPELLGALTDAFVAGGYRLRPLVAVVMKSKTYQLSATPNETNAEDDANFARAQVRLLPAETLLDAIAQALGATPLYPDVPPGTRASQLPGARMGGPFLKVFGKPDRLLTCECERSESTTLAQAFQLINGPAVRAALEDPENRIGRLLASGVSDEQILEELTLAALGRAPTATETSGFLGHVRVGDDRRRAWEDVAWALVNGKEFLLRH
jgi:hypothetical protein